MLIGAVADDITGAADLCLMLSRSGLRTVQIIGLPDPATPLPDADAVVIALKSRTIPADQAVALALAAGERPNTYVHCDYKLNNLTVSNTPEGWRVTGLFDLHEAHFADGALDIVRQACSYLDTERELAGVFVRAYLERVAPEPRLAALLPLYVLNDRMKFWGFFAPEAPDWLKGRTFRQWAQRYVDKLLALL